MEARYTDGNRQATDRASIQERPAVLDVDDLMKGRREIELFHRGSRYRLRVTRNGKLLLTK